MNLRLSWLACLVAALFLGVGCSGKKDDGKKDDHKDHKDDDHNKHDHPSKGPHGGPLAEWGKEDYHPEFTVDHKTKKATVYILGSDGKKPTPIDAETITLTITNVKPPVQLTLKAEPEASDPKGTSSRFSGTHDKLGEEMDFEGEIRGTVSGKPPFKGKFKEKDHDHKDHKDHKEK